MPIDRSTTNGVRPLVLLRHGESTWNKENRFTGWTDVDLTDKGREEAKIAGQLLKAEGYTFDLVFTSVLKRAIRTANIALDELEQLWLPVERKIRGSQRHQTTQCINSFCSVTANQRGTKKTVLRVGPTLT